MFIQKDKKDFNDLIAEQVISRTDSEATDWLKQVFPEKDVHVFTDRGGNTAIAVEDVQIRILMRT